MSGVDFFASIATPPSPPTERVSEAISSLSQREIGPTADVASLAAEAYEAETRAARATDRADRLQASWQAEVAARETAERELAATRAALAAASSPAALALAQTDEEIAMRALERRRARESGEADLGGLGGTGTSSPSSMPSGFYAHLLSLEGQLRRREAALAEVAKERATLTSQLASAQREIVRLGQEAASRDAASRSNTESGPHVVAALRADLTAAETANIVLREEISALSNVQRAKTRAIEEMVVTAESRVGTEAEVVELRRRLAAAQDSYEASTKEVTRLTALLKREQERLAKVEETEPGIPFDLWMHERTLMQTKVDKMAADLERCTGLNAKQAEALRRREEDIRIFVEAIRRDIGRVPIGVRRALDMVTERRVSSRRASLASPPRPSPTSRK